MGEDGTRKGIKRKTRISVMKKVEYGKVGQGKESRGKLGSV